MERLAAHTMRAAGPYLEKQLAPAKRRWLLPLRGDVLELGPGLGTNLPYLAQTQWTGLEPSAAMRDALRARGVPGSLLDGAAECIPLADASCDAVVATLVLCSVDDPRRVLAEIRRVLRPGGVFVYIEHVAAARAGLRAAQHLLRPVCSLIGCHPVRDTGQTIAQAGFACVEQEAYPVPGMAILPHIVGKASQT
ncbi:MAG: class I SAM-dependent methyltransferase [Bryobacteraceae bacterium]|nr:class I SAM-dependent methyltransferase [Bryobacteraceae bacterium]